MRHRCESVVAFNPLTTSATPQSPDAFEKQPYAFFSSYKVRNGYSRYGGTDCPTLGVWPYAEALSPTPRFLNPDSFQIISAGADGKFARGTDKASHVWSPAAAANIPAEGRDDQSNFHKELLGVPINSSKPAGP